LIPNTKIDDSNGVSWSEVCGNAQISVNKEIEISDDHANGFVSFGYRSGSHDKDDGSKDNHFDD
jgi:hypothetical protein